MKKFIAILVFAAGFALHGNSQTFLGDLQQKKQGEGTVVVKQSADIDNLVNNAKLKASSQQTASQQVEKTEGRVSPSSAHDIKKEHNSGETTAQHRQTTAERKADSNDKHIATTKPDSTERRPAAKSVTENETTERPVVDTSKKMMRNSYKVTGYRIQAFSGGNSRADREKANQIGDAIKMKYPEQPVYVHFYSPRWICRVGNFRSYNEAAQLLKGIKAMGYKQACIVKGKINVAY